jgi:DUF4097 and DUF4098 domain-containing protein YvlB
MDYTFSTPTAADLHVQIGAGTVSVTATDTDRTDVEVTGSGADDVLVEQVGDRVSVKERDVFRMFSSSRPLRVKVSLPTGSALTARLGSASLHCQGRLASCHVASGSGDVRLADTGDLDVMTGSGDLDAQHVAGDLRAKTGSGDVTAHDVTGSADLITGSGDLRLRGVGDRLTTKSGSGDVEVTHVGGDVSTTSGSGDVEIGQVHRGVVTCRSASGDVSVGVAAGTPTWTDLHTVSGRVAQELDSLGAPAEGQTHVELRIRTVSGRIRARHVART